MNDAGKARNLLFGMDIIRNWWELEEITLPAAVIFFEGLSALFSSPPELLIEQISVGYRRTHFASLGVVLIA